MTRLADIIYFGNSSVNRKRRKLVIGSRYAHIPVTVVRKSRAELRFCGNGGIHRTAVYDRSMTRLAADYTVAQNFINPEFRRRCDKGCILRDAKRLDVRLNRTDYLAQVHSPFQNRKFIDEIIVVA